MRKRGVFPRSVEKKNSPDLYYTTCLGRRDFPSAEVRGHPQGRGYLMVGHLAEKPQRGKSEVRVRLGRGYVEVFGLCSAMGALARVGRAKYQSRAKTRHGPALWRGGASVGCSRVQAPGRTLPHCATRRSPTYAIKLRAGELSTRRGCATLASR